MGRARDGGALSQDVAPRRAQHRRLQRPRRAKRARRARSSRARSQTGFDQETGDIAHEEEVMDLSPPALYRRHRRRDGRPDDGRRQGHRRRDPAPGPDGPRRRHPHRHGDAAPLGRRHHRHDQGELPDPHLLPGHVEDRQPHHPRRDGRRAAARPGRHALHGRRRPHHPRARPVRLGSRGRAGRRASEAAGAAGISRRRHATTRRTRRAPAPAGRGRRRVRQGSFGEDGGDAL